MEEVQGAKLDAKQSKMTQTEDISNVTIRNGVDLPSAVQRHEKQRFIYSNIRILLTDVVEIKGLPDYVH